MTPPAEIVVPSRRRRHVVWSMLGVIAVGIGLHATIRDEWQGFSAVLYYLLPSPVLTGLGLLATLFARRLSRIEWRITIVVATICLTWFSLKEFRWSGGSSAASDHKTTRVVFWNAAHLPRGVAVAAGVIRAWDADIVGIVEAGTTYEHELQEWQRELPGYTMIRPRAQMLLFARGEIIPGELITLGRHSDVAFARVQLQSGVIDVAIVDIIGKVDHGRAEPLRRLAEVVKQQTAPPQLVMGDFNTPPESVWLKPLRRTYRSAFELAGRGYRPTWPGPLPALELDYVWVGPDLLVDSCRHGWTTASDHRPVFVDVTIATTTTQSPESSNR